jgi:hypothetical protein
MRTAASVNLLIPSACSCNYGRLTKTYGGANATAGPYIADMCAFNFTEVAALTPSKHSTKIDTNCFDCLLYLHR